MEIFRIYSYSFDGYESIELNYNTISGPFEKHHIVGALTL